MKTILALAAFGAIVGAASAKTYEVTEGYWETEQLQVVIANGEMTTDTTRAEECWTGTAMTSFRIEQFIPAGCDVLQTTTSDTATSSDLSCILNGGKFDGKLDVRIFEGGDAFGFTILFSSMADDPATDDVISSVHSIGKNTGPCDP